MIGTGRKTELVGGVELNPVAFKKEQQVKDKFAGKILISTV